MFYKNFIQIQYKNVYIYTTIQTFGVNKILKHIKTFIQQGIDQKWQ